MKRIENENRREFLPRRALFTGAFLTRNLKKETDSISPLSGLSEKRILKTGSISPFSGASYRARIEKWREFILRRAPNSGDICVGRRHEAEPGNLGIFAEIVENCSKWLEHIGKASTSLAGTSSADSHLQRFRLQYPLRVPT